MLGECGRVSIQAVYFVLIARNLGAQQYGAFLAVTALCALVSPFVGNGISKLMVKQVAQDRKQFPEYWGNTLVLTAASGLVVTALLLGFSRLVLPSTIPMDVIGLIAVSEVMITPLLLSAGLAFQAYEQLGWMASLNVLSSAARLAAILGIVAIHRANLHVWSIAFTISTLTSAILGLSCVFWRLPFPQPQLAHIRKELREGFYFSTSVSAMTIYNDVDKTMLARLSTLDAAGIYGAAYRIVEVAFIPVKSVLAAAYPTFFRNGAHGIAESAAFGRRLLRKPLLYSTVIGIALFALAPVLPFLLGQQYSRTVTTLRWLSVLPVLKTMHYFIADSLTGAGYQGMRTLIQVIVASTNVVLNLWIIPTYSWRGTCWSSIACDALLLGMLAFLLLHVGRREKRQVTQAVGTPTNTACPLGELR